jgi:hypothetical protein
MTRNLIGASCFVFLCSCGNAITGNLGGSWYVKPGISAFDDTRFTVVNSTLGP